MTPSGSPNIVPVVERSEHFGLNAFHHSDTKLPAVQSL